MPNDVHVLIEGKEIFLELGLSWWGCLILLGVLAVIIGMVCCYRHWKRKVQKQKALRGKMDWTFLTLCVKPSKSLVRVRLLP